MIEPARAPISPQLAVRVASLGVIAFVLFAVIFFRLWFLQVLSGDQFLAEASKNRARPQPLQAPRGDIVDRNGAVLVENRKAIVLQLDPRAVPEEERVLAAGWGQAAAGRLDKPKGQRGPEIAIPPLPAELADRFQRLSRVTGLSVAELQERVVVKLSQEPFLPVVLTEDVTPAVRQFVEENRKDFRGLKVKDTFLREYPNDEVGAQLFGQLTEIREDQLGSTRYKGVKPGSIVGQNGLERTYDEYLRGKDGVESIYVDAANRPVGSLTTEQGRPGRQLRTTLDLGLQKAGEAALRRAAGAKPGAFVAMDPYTGEVLAMGSAPSFDPNELVGTLTVKRSRELFGEDGDAPLTNRAVSAQYSTGSTFKPVTALAALSAGVTTPGRSILDQGKIQLFPGPNGVRQNAKGTAFGPVDLRRAMTVSSDIYFYQVGKETFYAKKGTEIQTWARKLGFGRLTRIDTGAEARGVVPDKKWRQDLNDDEAKCRAGTEFPSGAKKAKGVACGIADGANRPYGAGDDVNLAIGQGDLQATPLQVALSYAAIANGERVPTPFIGAAIEEDGTGRLVQELKARRARPVRLPPAGLQAIRDGLRGAAGAAGGTSTGVFAGWDHARYPIHGKTGTAQRTGKADQSWYAAYVPRSATNKRPLLVVATVEGGGFGAEAAAPMVRQIFSQWYLDKPGPFTAVGNTE